MREGGRADEQRRVSPTVLQMQDAVVDERGGADESGEEPDDDDHLERRRAARLVGRRVAHDRAVAVLGHRHHAVDGTRDAEDRQEVDELTQHLGCKKQRRSPLMTITAGDISRPTCYRLHESRNLR